jgi:protein-L-isoaspartate(D-aspartate) O-methyltransferase
MFRIVSRTFPFLLFAFSLLAACIAPPGAPPSPAASPTLQPASTTLTPTEDPYLQVRMQLVETIKAQGVTDPDVLRAMQSLPRHAFVLPKYLDQAYANYALPIGYGQTISQPYVVAWMTEQLDLQPGEKVLEIGTGSGYQAAVLAELGSVEVYTIEIVPELAASAAERLQALGYSQVHCRQGDGYYGWEAYAPFDAIIVTAAPDHLPPPLAEQVVEGGRIVIPIGPPGWSQVLWKFVKKNGELTAYNLGLVGFVPFTGPGIEGSAPPSQP